MTSPISRWRRTGGDMQAGGINLFAAFRLQCITDEGVKREMEEMDIKYMKQA